MKIFEKIKCQDGRRKIFLFGKKIFSYKKKVTVNSGKASSTPIWCDIYNYEQLKQQGTIFPHLLGIVISRAAKIGNNCIIYQNVTIGARNVAEGDFNKPENYPVIGNNVTIYSGAVIAGPVKIGDNAVIGANAVVLNDVPNNATVVGIPAKIVATTKK